MNANEEEKKVIDAMSENEKATLRSAISLELSRAVMGYQSVDIYTISIFKQIPINSSLTETNIINALWEVEAVIGSVMKVGALAALRIKSMKEKEQTSTVVA